MAATSWADRIISCASPAPHAPHVFRRRSARYRDSPISPLAGAPQQTTTLAADAAGILERDYGIDAGEVLSMNVDTVETQTSASEIKSTTAAQMAEMYKCYEWGYDRNGSVSGDLWNAEHTAVSDTHGAFRGNARDFKDQIGDWFTIQDETINGKTRPTIMMQAKNGQVYSHKVFVDATNYVELSEGTKYSAKYETSLGVKDIGTSNVCGEAVYWFKFDEKNENGYGILFDNHTGCGFFSNADFKLYLVKMVDGYVYTYNMDKYSATAPDYRAWPEYQISVTEEDGLATIKISGSMDITWENVDVAMWDTSFTQAYDFYFFNGLYFADNKTEMTRTVTKSFGDIVYEPAWTDGALHMLINIDTKADKTMLGSDGGTEGDGSIALVSAALVGATAPRSPSALLFQHGSKSALKRGISPPRPCLYGYRMAGWETRKAR